MLDRRAKVKYRNFIVGSMSSDNEERWKCFSCTVVVRRYRYERNQYCRNLCACDPLFFLFFFSNTNRENFNFSSKEGRKRNDFFPPVEMISRNRLRKRSCRSQKTKLLVHNQYLEKKLTGIKSSRLLIINLVIFFQNCENER